MLCIGAARGLIGLVINTGRGKTETMGITKGEGAMQVRVTLNGRETQQVNGYNYLRSRLEEGGRCDEEIVRRIGTAKSVFTQMKNILTNISMGMAIRCRVLKCFVWSTMLYGCETWTLLKRMKERLEAVEMWFLRRMMRVTWTARISNE